MATAAEFGWSETASQMRPPSMADAVEIPALRASACPRQRAAELKGGADPRPACSGRCLMGCGKAITFLDH